MISDLFLGNRIKIGLTTVVVKLETENIFNLNGNIQIIKCNNVLSILTS